MPITSTKATDAQRAWLKNFEENTGFEPHAQAELDSGEMTFAAVAQLNIQWFEQWYIDTHLAIDKNIPCEADEDDSHAGD